MARITLLIFCACPGASPAVTVTSEAGTPHCSNDAAALVTDLLLDLQNTTAVPAFSVAVVKNGLMQLAVAVGEVDNRNHFGAASNHSFRLASVSKVVGATMLARLVQQGKLNPNAPLGNYLPDVYENYREITTAQLLAHTSGLPHYQAKDATIAMTHYDNATEAAQSVGQRELLSPPGSEYSYSSHGYTLAGAVYESIDGQNLTLAIPEFLSALTGRATPMLEDVTQRNKARSNVFEITSGKAVTAKPRDQSYSPFATGFIATASDLAKFGDAVLHSDAIEEETRELLFTPIHLANGGKTGTYLYEVAFGWRVGTDTAGRRVFHHAGVTQGARSVLILYPDDGLSIALLSNASWTAQIERTGFSIADIILDQQTESVETGVFRYSGTFEESKIAGKLECSETPGQCRFSDENGALSQWLRQYSPEPEDIKDWPAQVVAGTAGKVIKIATSVGFVDLALKRNSPVSNCFDAPLGRARTLQVCFADALSDQEPVESAFFNVPRVCR
jgi:CubicO group peptidase (beta-lactamase class C family)